MDLVNDHQPLGYLVEVQDDCESNYYLYDRIIEVDHYLTLDYPEGRATRLPYLFSNAFPFLLPPDKIYVEGYSVRAYWSGKEVRFVNSFVDPTGRAYSNNCSYNIRPASVSIEMVCCDIDQIHITIEHGNSRLQYLFYKVPYFPVLVLHPSYIVDELIVDGCRKRNSTKNTNPMYLNRDSYCLYDLLLLIYQWRLRAIPSATVVVDPISIFTSNIAEIDMSHVLFTSACYACLPTNQYNVSMTTDEYYEIVSTKVLPYACGTSVVTLLAAYTVLQLGGVFLPFLGAAFAFKPKDSYWVLVRAESPEMFNPLDPDFYLIHSDIIIISKCGEVECPLYILYDTDFVPSLDCINFEEEVGNITGYTITSEEEYDCVIRKFTYSLYEPNNPMTQEEFDNYAAGTDGEVAPGAIYAPDGASYAFLVISESRGFETYGGYVPCGAGPKKYYRFERRSWVLKLGTIEY